MKKEFVSGRESSIYPGLYTPNSELCDLRFKLQGENDAESTLTDFILDEFPDHYVIEIPASGVTRENIFVNVGNWRL